MQEREVRVYLSLIPQALIASMLTPQEFGIYYAIGQKARTRGEAIFFELDPGFRSEDFPFDLIEKRCVPHPGGAPKNSLYLSIYRVLSRVPVSALRNLYLATDDGKTLELTRGTYEPELERKLHLYQELCPITPMVASRLEAREFCKFITDERNPVHVPRIAFCELILRALATDPVHGDAGELPYPNLQHLRDVLEALKSDEEKTSKLFRRHVAEGLFYRTVRGGFFVGDQNDFAFYPMPSLISLEAHHHEWWRSAQVKHMD
jgi:hypothetical protein